MDDKQQYFRLPYSGKPEDRRIVVIRRGRKRKESSRKAAVFFPVKPEIDDGSEAGAASGSLQGTLHDHPSTRDRDQF